MVINHLLTGMILQAGRVDFFLSNMICSQPQGKVSWADWIRDTMYSESSKSRFRCEPVMMGDGGMIAVNRQPGPPKGSRFGREITLFQQHLGG